MIAFVYADTSPKSAPLYRTLIEGLVKNIREVMPRQEILLLTDETTPALKAVNHIFRIDKTVPLMTWRLKCHQVAHSMADEILFTEPDVRFQGDVMGDFGKADIYATTREIELEDERKNTPYTLGFTFSRSPEFWREAKIYCQQLSEKDQGWFGDMLAFTHVIDSGAFSVEKLDGAVYNHVVNDPEKPTNAKVLHYKGKRKAWLFPQAVEA